VPGFLLGTLFAFVLNVLCRLILYVICENAYDYSLTMTSVCLGLAFSILMPLVSNVIPTKRALGTNLRDSLDLTRTTTPVSVVTQRLQQIHLSPTEISIGVTLVTLGFVTFYVVPLSMIMMRIDMMFLVLNFLLVVVLVGVTLLATQLQHHLELLLLRAYLYIKPCQRPDKRLKPIISMNLKAHKTRNTQTALMFILSLNFLFFTVCSFHALVDIIGKMAYKLVGSDISAIGFVTPLDELRIAGYLEK